MFSWLYVLVEQPKRMLFNFHLGFHSDQLCSILKWQPATLKGISNIQLSFRLNGRNYLIWSLLVRTFLKRKGKLNHLIGTVPGESNPQLTAWDEVDSMIITWLWNLMLPKINGTCMFLTTARDIWETMRQTYS